MRGWGDALRRRALLRVMRLVGLDEEEGMRVNVNGTSGAKEDRGWLWCLVRLCCRWWFGDVLNCYGISIPNFLGLIVVRFWCIERSHECFISTSKGQSDLEVSSAIGNHLPYCTALVPYSSFEGAKKLLFEWGKTS